MRVLGIGAHPDDLEILSGGTLARYAAEGHYVAMCHLTTGDKGSFVKGDEDLATVRLKEAQAAAAVIGAEHLSLGIPDTEVLSADRRQRELVADLVRQVRPDVIITHSPKDYIDHNETAKLAIEGSFMAIHPQRITKHPHYPVLTPLYFMETISGVNVLPSEFVDITEFMDTKLEMFSKHVSQHDYLAEVGFSSMKDQIITTAKFRGHQSGVEYAEGFNQYHVALRGTTKRLLP